MKTIYLKVDGIHCISCEIKIKSALLKEKNVKDVKFLNNIVSIYYEDNVNKEKIVDIINNLEYKTKIKYFNDNLSKLKRNTKLKEFIIIFISIITIVIIINKVFDFNLFNMIPTIDSSITYGMLIVTGMLTSIHCIGMCGAINLMAVLSNDSKKNIRKPILYNVGRVLSYTLTGAVVGLIGSVLSVSYVVSGIIILIASILMFLMSLGMLEIIRFRIPKFISIRNKTKNAFVIGLLNGLMPCGPLQAMQIYALSTGSILKGALSMFLFGIGTVPLMFLTGVAVNIFSGKIRDIINKIAPVLILVLSLVMFNRALLTLNIDIFKIFNNYDNFESSLLVDDYQIIEFDLSYNNYEDFIIQKGVPVKMIIHVSERNLTGCNEELEIKEYNIKEKLKVGDNIIEFTPKDTGTFTYACWMNMIKNNIKVIDDIDYFKKEK